MIFIVFTLTYLSIQYLHLNILSVRQHLPEIGHGRLVHVLPSDQEHGSRYLRRHPRGDEQLLNRDFSEIIFLRFCGSIISIRGNFFS